MEILITDIRSWADRFIEINFSLTPKECNSVEDKLAKCAQSQYVTSNIYLYPPICLRRCLSIM